MVAARRRRTASCRSEAARPEGVSAMTRITPIHVGVGIALLCGVAGVWLWHRAQTHTEQAVLTALPWRRTVQIQRYIWTAHEHEDRCPVAARDCKSHKEVVDREQEEIGQSCSNIGRAFTNCNPVYITQSIYGARYSYQVREWHTARQVVATGDGGAPHWPGVILAGGEQPERTAGRSGEYLAVY